ncbi:uncharacterized protein L201_000518 [Kwoniella dendrophila CBS 6074]|uniref:BSD domain-containing protein n=1 Tax=Kwoniella dendrophila CBS 6074 TaxID=1295534 RepID=A0AAX4JJS0_9TREE
MSSASSSKEHEIPTASGSNAAESQSTVPPQPASPAETIQAEPTTSQAETTALTSDAPPTRTVQQALQQSINRNNFEEEVGQVMGTLSGWWGGFKKQSASTLTNIKADLDKTVTQAQADLEYLRTANIEVVRKDPAEYAAEQEAEKAKKEAAKLAKEEEVRSKEKGKGKEKLEDEGINEDTSATAQATNLLNKLTSSTTQLQNQLQSTLQFTLANNPNLSNPELIRKKLAENLKISSVNENIQLSMKQAEKLAEEYLKKSESFLKDAEKWVEDNVKVLPPDQQSLNNNQDENNNNHMVSMGWDGSDFYSFSTSSPTTSSSNTNFSHTSTSSKDRSSSKPISTLALAGSRKDALLRRLREDKDLLMVDPEGQGETEERKQEFKEWIQNHYENEKKELREQEEGNAGGIRMALVPEILTDDQFWKRYLFHKHMIEGEERKRKALLQATTTQEEETDDFNWDDEPEETSPVVPSTTSAPAVAPSGNTTTAEVTPKTENDGKLPFSTTTTTAIPKSVTSNTTSPRDSEESYDVVSDQGNVKKPIVQTTAPVTEDDEDSDWE